MSARLERRKVGPRRYGITTAALMLGLLFWARLIVVTDMPRTAIATEAGPEAPGLPDPDSPQGEPREDEAHPVRDPFFAHEADSLPNAE
jgi:hypothetical protein